MSKPYLDETNHTCRIIYDFCDNPRAVTCEGCYHTWQQWAHDVRNKKIEATKQEKMEVGII